MRFISSIGMGEIVIIKGPRCAETPRVDDPHRDQELGKVIGIFFQYGQMPVYQVRYRNSVNGQDVVAIFSGHELVNDPDFNHNARPECGYDHMKKEVEES